LGLSRSTTWTILRGHHKASGLSAAIVQRMLASPDLPDAARDVIRAYAADKAAGTFGHHPRRRKTFAARLNGLLAEPEIIAYM
jgi:hypothetical protein